VGARAISDQQPATTGGDQDVGSGLTIDAAAVYTATGIHAHRPLTRPRPPNEHRRFLAIPPADHHWRATTSGRPDMQASVRG
jgi:hypothetical protein